MAPNQAPKAQPFSADAVLRMASEGQSQRAGRWLETLLTRNFLELESLEWQNSWQKLKTTLLGIIWNVFTEYDNQNLSHLDGKAWAITWEYTEI